MKRFFNKLLFWKKKKPDWVRLILSQMYLLESQGKKPTWVNFCKVQKKMIEDLSADKRKALKKQYKWLERKSSRKDRYAAFILQKEGA